MVMRLRRSDFEGVLRFVHDAEELATDETPFPAETLARLADVVECDEIGTFEVDRVHRRDFPLDGEQDDRWWEIAHQQPICGYVEETGDFRALKLSDFLTPAQLHRLELYDEYLRPFGAEYLIMLPLPSPPWHERGFSLYRSRKDFSSRDREVLDLLSPHLVRLLERVELHRQLQVALAALDSSDVDQGIVLLDSDSHLDHATPRAQRLLVKYFPRADASPLPQAVAGWLAHSDRPLARERGAHRIVVHRIDQVLLVREEPVATANIERLTPREQQVLAWLAEGKTNAEIARILFAAPGTVGKHLEHIYEKLDVHTRTAAAAIARARPAAAA
jgi:DNA-binding CsgD family transcriptional regulator